MPSVLLVTASVVVAAVVALAVFVAAVFNSWQGKRIPGLPYVSVKEFVAAIKAKREQTFMDMLSKHGRVVSVGGMCVVSEPALVKQLLMHKPHTLRRHPIYNAAAKYTLPDGFGVLNMDGEGWKAHTRTMASIFHASNVAQYLDAMKAAVRAHADARTAAGGSGTDLVDTMRDMSADVVLQWGYGVNPASPEGREMLALLKFAGSVVHDSAQVNPKSNVVARYFNLRATNRRLTALLKPFMDGTAPVSSRAQVPEPMKNFVQRMHEDKFGSTELTAEVIHIYGAHKALGFVLACCLYYLTRNPSRSTADNEWATAIREETARVLAGRDIRDRNDLEQLPTIELVMNETLRMMPVNLMPMRWTGEPWKVSESVTVPEGPAAINLYGLHHDPELWEDPMTFNPRRFEKKIVPFSFVPFLLGKRMCAGMPLAKLEFAVMITTLLQHYDVEVPLDELTFVGSTYTGFEQPLPFKVTRRAASS